MRDPIDTIPQASRREPWNKGKLIGAKPPLRPLAAVAGGIDLSRRDSSPGWSVNGLPALGWTRASLERTHSAEQRRPSSTTARATCGQFSFC